MSFARNLALAIVILLIGWLCIKLLTALVVRFAERSGRKHSLIGNFAKNATSKVCWTILLVIILGRLGIDIGPLVAGLGITGFILGFAFQETLSNLASGLMIAINEPFKINDYVIIAGLEGKVVKVDMMATVLTTADNRKIVIPNKSAWGAPITNYTALGCRRVDIKIGIDYSCDVTKAIRIALEILPTIPGVMSDPAPVVNVASLDDSQVTLNIRPWSSCGDYWQVYNDTQIAIKKAFERNDIAIPFPQLTVHTDK